MCSMCTFGSSWPVRSVIYCCACTQTADTSSSPDAPPHPNRVQYCPAAETLYMSDGRNRTPEAWKTKCSNRFCTHTTTRLPVGGGGGASAQESSLSRITRRILRRPRTTPNVFREVECDGCNANSFVEVAVWICWACDTRNPLCDEPANVMGQRCIECRYAFDGACVVGWWTYRKSEGPWISSPFITRYTYGGRLVEKDSLLNEDFGFLQGKQVW